MIGIYDLTVHLGETLFYVALGLLPLVILFAPAFADLCKRKVRVLGIWFVLGAATAITAAIKFVVLGQNQMPFSQNLLRLPVLGSLAIMGINLPNLPKTWRLGLTHLCMVASTLLLAVCLAGGQRAVVRLVKTIRARFSLAPIQADRNYARAASAAYVCITAAGFTALCVVQSSINDLDRYYIIPSAIITACLVLFARWLHMKPAWRILVPALSILICYSLCAQQDYMSWNRARWAAAHWLEAKGIQSNEIDGGAEYDFEHNHMLYNTRFKGAAPYKNWRWWSISGERYIISFSPVPGYTEIAKQLYWSALTPFHSRELFILEHGPVTR
jgi:hypothetical protein